MTTPVEPLVRHEHDVRQETAARPEAVVPDRPFSGGGEKADRVRDMFGAIAARYDLLNRLLSLGMDRAWRREAVRHAIAGNPHDVLDVATGTADLALALQRSAPQARVIGVDFAEPMLEIARTKAARAGLGVELQIGDGTALPFPDDSFDVVTIAYGLRNFADVDAGLREFHRVLRPGGRLVVLEFPPPPSGALGVLFKAYFEQILPVVGGWISGDSAAYRYLPASVRAFPPPGELARAMHRLGFGGVRYKLQTFGISALHVAVKDDVGVMDSEHARAT